jgi:hypothetical protein
VRAALREVICEHGPAALSSPPQLANLLRNLLPDAPGINRMLVVAAEERVADQLRDHASAGMDGATAARPVASSFANRALYDPGTCTWLIGEIATALGPLSDTGYTPAVPAAQPPQPWSALGGRQHNVRFPVSPQTTEQILLGARRIKR